MEAITFRSSQEVTVTSRTMTRPFSFAGIPMERWLFGTRIWLALVLALAAGFWLQLGAPATAALCVAILAEPTRGRVLEKALFRLLATVIGVTAAIVFTALFSQSRDLMLAAFALWLGLCVYAAGLLDGNRAYAAVLSGYSVAIVAIQELDVPEHVFEFGMERGAAIALGIAAIALVNDLLAAPDQHPHLTSRLTALHRRVADYAGAVVRTATTDVANGAALLRDIASLRPEITSMASESTSGSIRAASARSVLVALVAEVHAARSLSAVLAADVPASREAIAAALGRRDSAATDLSVSLPVSQALTEVLRRDEEVRDGLAALHSGARPRRNWRTPLHRPYRAAAAQGVRATLCVALASAFFVLAGWSSTDVALGLVAVIIGLGAMTPNPLAFTVTALIAAPIAALLAGVMEFLVLDGVTEFPLLALALAPFVIGTTIAASWPNPMVAGIGRLTRIFGLIILAPSNPQSYDPNNFLFGSLFVAAGAAVLLVAQFIIPAVSAESRRRWLLASARRDFEHVRARWHRWAPEEAMFRDAVRIGQLTGLTPANPAQGESLQEALSMFDQAGTIRLSRVEGAA